MQERWSIWDEMRRIQEDMERAFAEFFRHEPLTQSNFMLPSRMHKDSIVKSEFRHPLADIWETDNEIVIKVELPGVEKKDIQVHAVEGGIEVKVERKAEYKEVDKKKGFYRFERSYSGFYRHFPLPEIADTSKVDATYSNGVLELKIPKKELKERKARQIEVK
ncbi:MAG: Hsp20/alpha crystallin family protein [Candidatus Aenigmatarchaeota archaeon]